MAPVQFFNALLGAADAMHRIIDEPFVVESRIGFNPDRSDLRYQFGASYTTKNPGHAPAWVLNEQAVPAFVRHNFGELPREDALLITAQLKKYSEDCGKS